MNENRNTIEETQQEQPPLCRVCNIPEDGEHLRHCTWCRRDQPLCEFITCDDCGAEYCPDCVHVLECDCQVCTTCERSHRHAEDDERIPVYISPYEDRPVNRGAFTFGIEIECEDDSRQYLMRESRLIAGWCHDQSLNYWGMEYQTQPFAWNIAYLEDLEVLVDQLPENTGYAGGHIHVARNGMQSPARWYWALKALDEEQCETLNMRHLSDSRWCCLEHDHYHGKDTAVNADHSDTIELRTFGAWDRSTSHKLMPALTWIHSMWRLFNKAPLYSLKTADITACSQTAYAHATSKRK